MLARAASAAAGPPSSNAVCGAIHENWATQSTTLRMEMRHGPAGPGQNEFGHCVRHAAKVQMRLSDAGAPAFDHSRTAKATYPKGQSTVPFQCM